MALSEGAQAVLNQALAKGTTQVTSSFIPQAERDAINAELTRRRAVETDRPETIVESPPPSEGMLQSIIDFGKRTGQTQLGTVSGISADSLARINQALAEETPLASGMLNQNNNAQDNTGLIQGIYQEELGRALGATGGDQGALDYWTSRLQAGATPEQLRREIEGTPEGIAFDVSSAYTGLLNREADTSGQQYFTEQLQTGALTPEQMRQVIQESPEFAQQTINTKIQTQPTELIQSVRETGSLSDLGSFFYNARKENSKIPAELMEELTKTRTDDDTVGYEFLIGAQAYSEGLDALDQAVAAGDEAKANELRRELANENTFYGYYLDNIASNDDQHHRNLRNETLTGSVYGIGDPQGGVKGSLERGLTRLGDAIGDVVDNPFVQATVTAIYPPAGAVLNAYATLDSGENLSPAQVVAALAGVNDMIPGGSTIGNQLLSKLPESVQKFVQATKDFADGATGRAVTALKQAFPNVDTEKLAEYEDDFKNFLAGGEDVIRNVVGDENIEALSSNIASLEDAIRAIADSTGETYQEVSNRLAGVEDFIRENIGNDNIAAISSGFASFEDLIRGQFGTQQEQIDRVAAALAADRTGGFVAQRGYQPGLPVDTRFGTNDRSMVLEILNA